MAEPVRAGPLRFILEKGLAILTVLVAISYAVIRPAYDEFYAPLGLAPEDIGLTQVGMISRGAAMIVYTLAFIALPFLISICIYLSVRGRRSPLQRAILATLLAISAFMILWKRNEIAVMPLSLYAAVCVFLGSIGAVGVLVYQRTVRGPLELRERIFPHATSAGPSLLLVVIAILLLLAFGESTWFSARAAGQRYLESGTLDQFAIAAWLNIRNTKVTAIPIGQDTRQICGRFDDARLLGRSGDATYILFLSSRENSQVLRIPDDEYKVTPTLEDPPCQSPPKEAAATPSPP